MPPANRTNTQAHVGRIRRALQHRGTSLREWGAARGYRERTVYTVVHTWAGRVDREPHGGIARSIMADLRAYLGPQIVPAPIPTTPREAA